MDAVNVSRPQAGFERRAFRKDRVEPRKTSFTFPPDIPRYWVGQSPTRTHLMNALHLFVPSFERMIMRTVLDRVIPLLHDPQLVAQARGFARQEGSHARAHTLFLENLRAQGYDLDRYLKLTDWYFDVLLEKKLGLGLALSTVAGFEHYTDLLVLLVLREDFLDDCDPRMKELLSWHTAEEIEHKAVAYAMLQAIDDGYGLRMAGNVLGLMTILMFLLSGTALLLHQDGKLGDRRTRRELGEFFFTKYRAAGVLVKLFARYARPGYRPEDTDDSDLARRVLDEAPST